MQLLCDFYGGEITFLLVDRYRYIDIFAFMAEVIDLFPIH